MAISILSGAEAGNTSMLRESTRFGFWFFFLKTETLSLDIKSPNFYILNSGGPIPLL